MFINLRCPALAWCLVFEGAVDKSLLEIAVFQKQKTAIQYWPELPTSTVKTLSPDEIFIRHQRGLYIFMSEWVTFYGLAVAS